MELTFVASRKRYVNVNRLMDEQTVSHCDRNEWFRCGCLPLAMVV